MVTSLAYENWLEPQFLPGESKRVKGNSKSSKSTRTENQVRFLAEVTEQITELFNVNLDSAKWDSGALDNFLNILNTRMLNELKNCAASYRETKEQRHTNMTLKKHFRKLKRILKKANYSADSWEQIRRLVRNHLTRMDIIASNLKSALTG
ncbi:interferon a3-like [Electrophorus electricus]|uniref:interferon a3-like n=1 Tax=Electrophorus electricus TaxID=8005 RepID=UPI0015D08565|nr:interferon a3-like [Electrophorus electricus]